MKPILILITFSFSIYLSAQTKKLEIPVETETGIVKFKEVIDEEGTQDELFNRCVYWLNNFYKDPTRVTTIRDVPTVVKLLAGISLGFIMIRKA